MLYEPNLYRYTRCECCGVRFMDDCGDAFCSSTCEEQWEYEHKCCEQCGEEFGGDFLNENGICENCLEEREEELHGLCDRRTLPEPSLPSKTA